MDWLRLREIPHFALKQSRFRTNSNFFNNFVFGCHTAFAGAVARIRGMGVYFYGERRIETLVHASERQRARFCAGAAVILGAAAVTAWLRPDWIFGVGNHARGWVIAALFVFFAGPLAENLWRWQSRTARLRESLRHFRVEVSADGARILAAAGTRELRREEIVRAEEVGWGLYLRTAERYRWILIPARLDGFAELRRELAEQGIPLETTAMAPNWEEFAGAVLFVGTMICAIFARSRTVLEVDLAVSVVIAVAGFVVVSANPENLPKMRWVRLGIFLPVLMTGSMLWSAWR